MTKDKEYDIKDQILKKLANSENQFAALSELSEQLQISFDIICTLSDDLIEERFLENRGNLTAEKREWHGDKMVLLSQKGKYFVGHDGGYANRQKAETKLELERQKESRLNRIKVNTDIGKNIITIVVAVIGGLYTIIDFIGSAINDSFDLARLVLNMFK